MAIFRTFCVSLLLSISYIHSNAQCDPDNINPIAQIADVLGNVLADNNVFTIPGTAFNFGTTTLLQGVCSRVDYFYITAFDDCDGIINNPNAAEIVSATNNLTGFSNPQAEIYPDGFGTYGLQIHWPVGESSVVVGIQDAAGNQVTLTLLRTLKPSTNAVIACIPEIIIPLDDNCRAEVSLTQLVTGMSDCFPDQDVSIQVEGANPMNSLNISGSGIYPYSIEVPSLDFYCGGIIRALGYGPHSFCNDIDIDGIPDFEDNCPSISNPSQDDVNNNGIGDDCEFIAGSDDLQIANSAGDIYLENWSRGVIMKNVLGKCYRLNIDSKGNIVTTLITCPD